MSSRSIARRSVTIAGLSALCAGALFAQGQIAPAGPGAAPAAVVNASDDPMLRGITFRSIGPAVMGGRIDDIEGADKDPMLLYVGFATGGLWQSKDGGIRWRPMLDNMPNNSIGDIAIAPSDPNIVYVGMGEPNNRQSSSIGNGVYKTTDGGATWTHIGLEDTQSIGRVAVDPVNPNVVFVAAVGHLFGPNEERGLYKSIDGGRNWTKSKYIDADTGFTDVAIDPANPKIVYAASYQRRRTWWGFNGGGPGSGLWKSTDAGATWTKLTGGGFPAPPDGIIGRIGIDIFRKKPTTIFMIAEVGAEAGIQVGVMDDGLPTGRGRSTQRNGATRSGVWRSDDAGKTWTFLTNVNDRPLYYSQIRVDPSNDMKLIQSGATAQISTDGGKSWRPIAGTGHGDYHAIWINPKEPRNIAVGHDGGLDISNDGGVSWQYHNDMAVGQFYQVSADMRRPYVVCGGLQDNNCWCGPSAVRSSGGGPTNSDWFSVGGGDGFYTRQDPTDWAIVYSESQNGNMNRFDLRAGTTKAIRPNPGRIGGAPPPAAGAAPPPPPPPGAGRGNILNMPADIAELRFYWNTPIELSPHDPSVIYTGAQYFFKSTNRGDAWWMNPKDLTKRFDRFTTPIMGVAGDKPMASKHDGWATASIISAIGESPARPGVIWIGTDDGTLQVSQDGGVTFTSVFDNVSAAGGPRGYTHIARVEPSHFDGGTAYVAIDNHRSDDWKPYLFKTADYGRTWTAVAGNLPVKGNINAVREDPVNPNLLFVGTEFGLFVTLDGGREWKPLMTGLPRVRIDDILIHPRDRDLIVATHGRSIWIADDITPLEQIASASGNDVQFFQPRPAVLWKNDLQLQQRVTGTQFRGQNPQGGTAISFWSRTAAGDAKIEVLENGQVIRTMTMATEPGMNRFQWDLARDAAAGAASVPVNGRPGGRGVPFVAGGRGGGGFGGVRPTTVAPGAYLLRLTVGGQVYLQSVSVLEDVWMTVR